MPPDGTRPHTFSIARRPATHAHFAGESCVACDLTPGVAEGPLSPVGHLHSAVEIAHLLQLVAGGSSLREASHVVRVEAQRFELDRHRVRRASRSHILAARYLDLFGTAVDEALAPTVCPRILVLDAKPLMLRAHRAQELVPGWNPNTRACHVLVAMGADRPGQEPRPWRIALAGDDGQLSWGRFLDEIEGSPEWVVGDGSAALRLAVDARWGDEATFYNCEFHLRRLLQNAAADDGIATEADAVRPLFRGALWSTAHWDAVRAYAAVPGRPKLDRWCRDNDALVREQLVLRRRFPDHPHSNTSAEAVIHWIDDHLPRRRRVGLRNATRLQLVLTLMRAHHAGQADLPTLAAIVKRRMLALGPGEAFDWGARMDPRTEPGSIAQLIIESVGDGRARTRAYMVEAKTRSVFGNLAVRNAERAELGAPPLVATTTRGHRTASVKVAGLWLARDFPEVAQEWDVERNEVALESVRAGSGYAAHWICRRCGHRWVAEVNQRTGRGTRCQRCQTERANDWNSLAAVHPELLVEWDHHGNEDLRPERIKATYDRSVSWRCAVDPTHPTWRMSPITRARHPIGCPLCRRRAAAASARATPAA